MRRKFAAAVIVGWSSFALLACVGDDTNAPLDPGPSDATVGADGATPKGDGGVDGGACVPYDAGGLSDAQVQLGRSLVTQKKCQDCHGETLGGNRNGVPAPGGGSAYPPNLTSDPQTGLGCWSDSEIANAILNGVDDEGSPLCPPMPMFARDAGLDSVGAAAIVAYLRSLPVTVNQVQDTQCSAPVDAGDAGSPSDDAGQDSSAPDAADGGSPADTGSDAPLATDASDAASSDAGSSDAGTSDAALDASSD
jgi:hypothetical protein